MTNTAKEFTNRVSSNIPRDECLDIEQLAKEMGVGVLRARQIVKLAIVKRQTPNLTKFEGRKALYPEAMVRSIIEAYDSGKLTKRRRNNVVMSSKRAMKNAAVVFEVPLFDPDIANVVLQQFGSPEEVVKFFQEKLKDHYMPVISRIKELEEEFENKKKSIYSVGTMNGASVNKRVL